ncbi:MAG: DUF805 domain-containing protein [Akkermansia sp.]|nr:DUF805 domain-containing protein [Akkermansia sp.]
MMPDSNLPSVPQVVEQPSLWGCFCATLKRDRYAVFRGRASRREYWSCMLFGSLLTLLPLFLLPFCLLLSEPFSLVAAAGLLLLFLLVALYLALPMTTVLVRRLHDVGRSAWWVVFFFSFFCIAYALYVFCIVNLMMEASVFYAHLMDMSGGCEEVADVLLTRMLTKELVSGPMWFCQFILLPFCSATAVPLFIFTLLPGQRKENLYGDIPRW